MVDEYDDPSDPELRTKFHREGKVVFLVSSRAASMLKKLTENDIKLGMINRRVGWKNQVFAKYLMITGIIRTIFLSVYSQQAADIFAFFAIDRTYIKNIDEKKTPEGEIVLTFSKKQMAN